MRMSYQDCLKKMKEIHKDLYPIWYIDIGGKYLFNMLKRGVNKEEAFSNLYVIDPETGESSGSLPVMALYGDKRISEKFNSPNMIPAEDQQLEHAFLKNDNYLMHYGIKGQRWGIRRFQNEDGTLTAEGKSRYKNTTNGPDSSKKLSFREKRLKAEADRGDQWLNDMDKETTDIINREETKKDKSSRNIIMDVLSFVVDPLGTTAMLTAESGISAYSNHKLKKYFRDREEKCEKDPKTGLYLKSGEVDEKTDLASVNPGVYNMNTNTKNNCMLCTTTYDLRKRGYDVTAQLDSQGYSFGDIKKWYPKAKIEKNSRYNEDGKAITQQEYVDKTIKNLQKQGDGARGNLMVLFKSGGAHSIVYEVKNGKVIFKDSQINQVYDGKISLTRASSSPEQFLYGTTSNAFARLDNVEPDYGEIKKYCVR